ncbi:MAG TPA: tetratricopeptide repeat protein [Gemmatimonadales bacterium]|nr:tetratricopeptide repeat protein [Gemmatimonadales bacterium]
MTAPHWRRRLRRRRLAVELAARANESEATAEYGFEQAATDPATLPFQLVADERGAAPWAGEAKAAPTKASPESTQSGDAVATDGTAAASQPGIPQEAGAGLATAQPTARERELLCRAAEEAIERGDWRRGEAICREVLEADRDHPEARRLLALAYERGGDRERALGELNKVIARDGEDVRARIARAALLGRRGRYAEAEQDLRLILERNPAHAEACHQLGIVIARKARWKDAVPHLRRAVELDAGCAEAHLSLAEALNHVDDLAGALQAYQRAAELRPTSAKALYGLGIVLDRLNRPADAAVMYRRSREIGTA